MAKLPTVQERQRLNQGTPITAVSPVRGVFESTNRLGRSLLGFGGVITDIAMKAKNEKDQLAAAEARRQVLEAKQNALQKANEIALKNKGATFENDFKKFYQEELSKYKDSFDSTLDDSLRAKVELIRRSGLTEAIGEVRKRKFVIQDQFTKADDTKFFNDLYSNVLQNPDSAKDALTIAEQYVSSTPGMAIDPRTGIPRDIKRLEKARQMIASAALEGYLSGDKPRYDKAKQFFRDNIELFPSSKVPAIKKALDERFVEDLTRKYAVLQKTEAIKRKKLEITSFDTSRDFLLKIKDAGDKSVAELDQVMKDIKGAFEQGILTQQDFNMLRRIVSIEEGEDSEEFIGDIVLDIVDGQSFSTIKEKALQGVVDKKIKITSVASILNLVRSLSGRDGSKTAGFNEEKRLINLFIKRNFIDTGGKLKFLGLSGELTKAAFFRLATNYGQAIDRGKRPGAALVEAIQKDEVLKGLLKTSFMTVNEHGDAVMKSFNSIEEIQNELKNLAIRYSEEKDPEVVKRMERIMKKLKVDLDNVQFFKQIGIEVLKNGGQSK